jgi:hypothetical protein
MRNDHQPTFIILDPLDNLFFICFVSTANKFYLEFNGNVIMDYFYVGSWTQYLSPAWGHGGGAAFVSN